MPKMNTTLPKLLVALLVTLSLATSGLHGQAITDFTYQGQLTEAGGPANGSYDIRFELFNHASAAPNGSTIISFGVQTVTDVAVADGIFTTQIDFGQSVWGSGADSFFIELAVREADSGDPFTVLSPRQEVTPAPLATFALGVSATTIFGEISDGNLPSTFSSARTFSNPGNVFFGDGSNLTAIDATELTGTIPTATIPTIPAGALDNAWQLGGNAGTTAGTDFIGTTDTVTLDFRVNNTRGLRLEAAGGSLVNVIGGNTGNSVASAFTTIGGGGNSTGPNTIGSQSDGATIAGGVNNTIGAGSPESSISGGSANSILADASRGVIGGGRENSIGVDADNSTISGGNTNVVGQDAASATIGGGASNTINQSAAGGTIAGGSANVIAADAFSATVGGGSGNTAGGTDGGFPSGFGAVVAGGQNNEAIGNRAVVSGGLDNSATGAAGVVAGGSNNNTEGLLAAIGGGTDNAAIGSFSTVPGGELNEAFFSHSFAAGFRAKAVHEGAFVWSDNLDDSDFSSAATGEFAVRATGGARFETGGTGLSVDGATFYIAGNATSSRFAQATDYTFNPNAALPGLIIESGFQESSGIHFDSDSVSIWSPADNDRLVRFIDEDGMFERAYIDGNGGIHSVASDISAGGNVSAGSNVSAGGDLIAAGGLTFTEEGFGDTARITFLDNSKYIEGSEENNAMRFQASRFGFNRFPSISGNAATLQLEGSASKTTAGSWLAHSDRRIKTDVKTIEGPGALAVLAKVRPVSFRYSDAYLAKHPSIEHRDYINVIAQEFAQVFPDWVSDSGETLPGESGSLLQVDTYPLTFYSVAAISELEEQVRTQAQSIVHLKQRNQDLEARLAKLERLIEIGAAPVSD
jgi:hypothetical protein